MPMYELINANGNSPPFLASNIVNLNSVGIDHFLDLEDSAGPVLGTGGNDATSGGE